MNLCNEWEDQTGKCLARDHGALTEWNATGSMINRILEGQTDNGFSTWCNLKNSYLIYLGSTSYQLRWFTSEDMLINLFRRYIFDKKGRLSVIRIWTFPNFYYFDWFQKVISSLRLSRSVSLSLYSMSHKTDANTLRSCKRKSLLPCFTLFLRDTYSSFKSIMFLKALPFNPFMSLSFRRLRYLPNKLINSVKIPLKFIAQGRGITETIFNVLPIWQKFALLS